MDRPTLITLPARFELDREIGRGGMVVVYRAHDRHLGRFVPIEVLSAGLSSSVGVERFQREIALMARLVQPGIVALFDSGESDGRLFYVMPFVSGETLRAPRPSSKAACAAPATGCESRCGASAPMARCDGPTTRTARWMTCLRVKTPCRKPSRASHDDSLGTVAGARS
jgi:hypothetical protein